MCKETTDRLPLAQAHNPGMCLEDWELNPLSHTSQGSHVFSSALNLERLMP